MAELTGSAETICGDGRYVRGFDGMIDLSEVAASISVGNIKELIDFTMERKKHGDGQRAVLVTAPIAAAFLMLFQRGVPPDHP